jgi:phosphatidylserine/phosphatidylglycerophosphate/cardiolipin synthase-like enzyme
MRHLKLHAKVLLADKARAIVGSINLTSSSFDNRRELAIQANDRDVVRRLVNVVRDDWRNSRVLDLSNRAVLSDLTRHPKNGGLTKIAPVAIKQETSPWESSGTSGLCRITDTESRRENFTATSTRFVFKHIA